jgi:3-methyladenine DNA glycosylase AlkD
MRRAKEIVSALNSLADPDNVRGMARFGINPRGTLGVSMPVLRKMAKETGRDHALALELWETGIHEARILAALVADPAKTTASQMESWLKDLDSWDVTDQVCMNLFDRTSCAHEKALAWTGRKREFEKRGGFALIACLALHDKTAPDEKLEKFLPAIERESDDPRNFVKKAVSWALRHIGKRNGRLNKLAVAAAKRIGKRDSNAAKWVSRDVLKELTGEKVRRKLAAGVPKKKARKKRAKYAVGAGRLHRG